MTTQPTIFGHADTATRQPEFFRRGGRVSGLSCEQCGEPLERTPGGYLACPKGHGKLYEACNNPAVWDGDDEDLFGDLTGSE